MASRALMSSRQGGTQEYSPRKPHARHSFLQFASLEWSLTEGVVGIQQNLKVYDLCEPPHLFAMANTAFMALTPTGKLNMPIAARD
eukprot:6480992-Amphidinium_carterae.1